MNGELSLWEEQKETEALIYDGSKRSEGGENNPFFFSFQK